MEGHLYFEYKQNGSPQILIMSVSKKTIHILNIYIPTKHVYLIAPNEIINCVLIVKELNTPEVH